MSERIRDTSEDFELFRKVMIAFSFVQLVLSLLLFLLTAIAQVVLWALAAMAIVALVMAAKSWEKKPIRVIVRVMYGLLTMVPLVLSILTMIATFGMSDAGMTIDYGLIQFMGILCIFVQTTTLFALPIMAVSAFHAKKFDIRCMRVFSAVEVFLALITCFYLPKYEMIVMGIDNVYFSAFFCLCTAVTATASFAAFPLHMGFPRIQSKRRKSMEATADVADDDKTVGDSSGEIEKDTADIE